VAFQGRRREVDLVVQCVFSNQAGGGRSLHQAFDNQGTELETKVVSQDQSDYAVTESIAITLSRGYLVSHAQSGLDMKLVGETGDVIIKIPAAFGRLCARFSTRVKILTTTFGWVAVAQTGTDQL
jgi:hypothetical protein